MFIPANYNRTYSDVEWSDSVVIFGSNWVYNNTLSDYTERPVINVGVEESSISFSVYNQIALAEQCTWHAPYAVVNVWPEIFNHTFFGSVEAKQVNENMDTRLGKQFYDLWNLHSSNSRTHGEFMRRMSMLLWDKKSLYVETTPYESTANAFDIECVPEEKIAEFILYHLQ